MRIRSKFQDYYDCGLAYGIDENIAYIRDTISHAFEFSNGSNTREAQIKETRPVRLLKNSRYGYVAQSRLYFCGKIYPFYVYSVEKDTKKRDAFGSPIIERWLEYVWTPEKAEEVFKPISENSMWGDEKRDFENEWTIRNDEVLNQKFQSPVVLEIIDGPLEFGFASSYPHNKGFHIVDHCLKDIKFQSIIDPYTAFQEISMYLAMLQNPEDKDLDPEATDIEKVRQHGMDEKYGFRKTPSK